MTIHIENQTVHITIAPPNGIPAIGAAFLRAFMPVTEDSGADGMEFAAQTQAPAGRPAIGDYWPGQGGFYAGDMRGDDGTVYGLIVSDCDVAKDAGTAKWGPEGQHQLSEWDGLANTQALGASHAAAKLATTHSADQHSDFYLPARRELQLACATVPHLFGTDGWYWTSTPRSEDYAWAVDFEYGRTNGNVRDDEFRVRPVRRFIY